MQYAGKALKAVKIKLNTKNNRLFILLYRYLLVFLQHNKEGKCTFSRNNAVLSLKFCTTLNKSIMKQTKKNATVANDSNNVATVANVNLPEIEVQDATTTKGKVSAKFTLVNEAQKVQESEKVDKNQLFSVELNDYFCPVKFDSSTMEASLAPLVSSGILSEDAKAKAIETAKREFFAAHESEINAAQNLSFAEVVAKLKENETLYKKVLTACNVSTLEESCYVDEKSGKVMIYRANQCQDKEGNDRYQEATVKRTENGKEFSQPLFVELREQTTSNILLAIRYYSSKQNATKTLLNKVTDYKRILIYVFEAAKKAKENGFSLEQVTEQVTKVFAGSTVEETK